MSLDPDSFRAALGRFASGVTVVTCTDEHGHDHGMTVSAFTSVSLQPPLILICIDRQATMYDVVLAAPSFMVNVLSHEQEALARRFAETGNQRFSGIGFSRSECGAAVLDGVLACLECRRTAQYEMGDHTVVVGEVEMASLYNDKPLLYYRSGFTQLER